MFIKFWWTKRLFFKLLICVMVLFLVPVAVVANLTFSHLRTIKAVSLQEVRSALVTSQVDFLKNHMAEKAEIVSAEFSDIQDQLRMLNALSKAVLTNPAEFTYRNGSHYRLDDEGDYVNPVDDGNSSLFVPSQLPSLDSLIPAMENFNFERVQRDVPRYNKSLDALIAATENLDILLKPMIDLEPKVVLGWFIHKDQVTRTYPWRNFKRLPRYPEITSWPFYYLSDPEHNPSGREVFTPVYIDPLTQHSMISCLSPVIIDGEHVATVGVDITVEALLQEIGQVRLGEGSSSLLLSSDGIIAASENLPLAALGLNPAKPAYGQTFALEDLTEAGQAVVKSRPAKAGAEFIETKDLRVYVGYAEVEPLGWRLFLLVPESDLLGPVNEKAQAIFSEAERIRGNFLHILIFTILAMASVGYVVVAHQSRGLRTLLGGIREFGFGNLSHRIREEKTEFGELAQALNSMAESLQLKKVELKKAYAEVERGRKLTAVGRLAAGVAHEVNNPLATISTYTQTVLSLKGLPPEAAERLVKVMGEIERIQKNLRSLLDLSRVQPMEKEKTNLNLLVREIADMATHTAANSGINLVLSLDPEPKEFYVDRSGIKQILWNLLNNSFDALAEGGTVSIRTRSAPAEDGAHDFILEVEDDGSGIPEDLLPQIFEPFVTTKEVGKGTGLGLAVIYSIVSNFGGTVEVQNVAPHGCLVRIVLPGAKE